MTDQTALNPQDAEELAALCEGRAELYGMVARLFRTEADQELLDELHGMLFPVESGNAKLDEGNHLVARELSNLWEDSQTRLAIDYARCFMGSGIDAHAAAYPFESVYTSEKRLLMQDARDEVRAIYLACGLQKGDEWKEGEDHLALELELLQVLCLRAAERLRAHDEDGAWSVFKTQLNFLEDHVETWVPLLAEDMRHFAKSDLYLGLSYLAEGLVETEVDFLRDLLDEGE